ncbi:MAG: dihydrolipoyl dehydrogenase [Gammaproteobacteria bacterium]|nr:MAG: dihydrolipoyl dehydrogenase [Gammaproteobacteria bacterium]
MDYDVIILGAGPAGYVAAIRCAQYGKKVAVIDPWHNGKVAALGGVCLNAGCIPSKALLDSTQRYAELKTLSEHGIMIDKATIDLDSMMQRKDQIVDKLVNGIALLFKRHGIEWLQGHGKLVGPHDVEIQPVDKNAPARTLQAESIILATGSRPAELPGIPYDGTHILHATHALSLRQIPKRLAIIGAGAVGLELGSVWNRLGTEVHVFEGLSNFLPFLDPRLSRQIHSHLTNETFQLTLGVKIEGANIDQDMVKLDVRAADGKLITHTAELLLVAAGRRPNTENLIAEDVGLAIAENGEITVDHQCRTNLENVYAIGDIVRGPKLAHKGSAEGRMVAALIAGQYDQIDYDCIPAVIYTHPEMAWVGLNEPQIKQQQIPYQIGQASFATNGRALAGGATTGMVKFFVEKNSSRILGAQIVGPEASLLIQEIVSLMEFSGTAEDLAAMIHAHPALSEVLHEAAEDCMGMAIHKA